MITEENWSICQYKSQKLQAFISLCASPSHTENKEFYSVTLTDLEFHEVFQNDFEQLEKAIQFINEKYGHWEFNNLQKSGSDSGCSTCQAH